MVEQRSSLVHGRPGHSGRPVKCWVVPLGQSWLLGLDLRVASLVRDMVLVKTKFVICISLLLPVPNLLS